MPVVRLCCSVCFASYEPVRIRMCVYVRGKENKCVCVCERERKCSHLLAYTHTSTYKYSTCISTYTNTLKLKHTNTHTHTYTHTQKSSTRSSHVVEAASVPLQVRGGRLKHKGAVLFFVPIALGLTRDTGRGLCVCVCVCVCVKVCACKHVTQY
jgi:hypothetical protein